MTVETGHGGDRDRLRSECDRLRRLLDHSRDGIHELDLHTGRYVYMNAAQERLTGFSRSDLVGMSAEEAAERLHPEDRHAVEAYLDRVIAGEQVREPMEYRWRVASGEYRWFSDSRTLVRGADGAPGSLVGVSRDVTEHRRAEEELRRSEERFRLAAAAARMGAYCRDLKTGRDHWSPEFLAIFGLQPGERLPLRDGIPAAVHPDDRERVAAEARERFARRIEPSFQSEHRIVTPIGEVRWVMVSGRLEFGADGEPEVVHGLALDLTARKAAEEALRASRDELARLAHGLELRVQERTRELERSACRLRQLHAELARTEQRERSQLASVLHDGLQQLLVAARMRLSSIRGRTGEAADPVLQSVEELLEQSLEASRSLTVELSPPVLLDRGMKPALTWLTEQVRRRHGLRIRLAVDEASDPGSEDLRLLVFHAVRELLFNVVKHAGVDQATVTVRRLGERIGVEVTDEGRGFQQRAPGPDDGFGLFNLQQRVEWVGGTIEVESAPGEGTRVRLLIPLAVPVTRRRMPRADATDHAPARPAPRAASPAADVPVEVLLVDDHELVREGLVSLLEGYPDIAVVAEAGDGASAVDLALRRRPELVVMDVSMPGMDGIEATRRITERLPDVRVIGLSMHDSAEVAEAMAEAGATGFHRKDAPIDDLVRLIRAAARPRPAV